MSVLQNFKKACLPGKTVIFTAFWCPTPTVRTVKLARSRDCAFTGVKNPGNLSYLTWPKASEISEPKPNCFHIALTEGRSTPEVLVYDFNVPATAPEAQAV
jgi:hypothetical protein